MHTTHRDPPHTADPLGNADLLTAPNVQATPARPPLRPLSVGIRCCFSLCWVLCLRRPCVCPRAMGGGVTGLGVRMQIGAMAYFWTNDTPWGAEGPGASHGSVIAALKCPFDAECGLSSQVKSDPW